MFQWIKLKRRFLIIAVAVLVCSTLIATFAYRTATTAFVKPLPTATKAVKTLLPYLQARYLALRAIF